MIHLDTSFVVDLFRDRQRGRAGAAARFIASRGEEDLGVSIFVVCELLLGVELSQRVEEAKEELRLFCSAVNIIYPDEHFPEVFSKTERFLRRAGTLVGPMDVLIASTALAYGAPIVTGNVREFSRIPGLEVLAYRASHSESAPTSPAP